MVKKRPLFKVSINTRTSCSDTPFNMRTLGGKLRFGAQSTFSSTFLPLTGTKLIQGLPASPEPGNIIMDNYFAYEQWIYLELI